MLGGMRQVNFRAPDEVVAAVDAVAGRGGRNAWVLGAVRERLAREGLSPAVPVPVPVPVPVVAESVPAPAPAPAPASAGGNTSRLRAPLGCRVVGASRLARVLAEEAPPVVLPGRLELVS